LHTTSEFLKKKYFDLCFIDGIHKYSYVKRDFENIGKYANICMFHDINSIYNPLYPEHACPGVVKFWKELKKTKNNEYKFEEFLYHSEKIHFIGIGLAIKKSLFN